MLHMYVLVAKVPFAHEETELDDRFYRQLSAKIRARHRVCAHIYTEDEEVVLALTALSPRRDDLAQLCERICVLCEREGLGRAAATEALIAHIDSLG